MRVQEDEDDINFNLSEALIDQLRKCQITNPALQGMNMDELVALALTRYLEKKSVKPLSQFNRFKVDYRFVRFSDNGIRRPRYPPANCGPSTDMRTIITFKLSPT